MITPTNAPFALHAVVETAAALSFIFAPEKQLPGCSPAARLILRQYGGLLLSSSAVCLAVLLLEPGFGNSSSTCRWIAAALGTYHVWPCYRAYVRLRFASGSGGGGLTPPGKEKEKEKEYTNSSSTLGGPAVHLVVHLLCFGGFVFAFAFGNQSQWS